MLWHWPPREEDCPWSKLHLLLITIVLHNVSRYAYSLEENKQRDRAEEVARKALSMEAKVPWAYHALSEFVWVHACVCVCVCVCVRDLPCRSCD